MHIYVIVPHPDDEVLLCGATIAKYVAAGDTVTVCHVKMPETPRESIQHKDALEAKRILGYTHLRQMQISSSTMLTDFTHLKACVEKELASCSPIDILYTVSGNDNHQDHQALFRAVSVATRPVSISIPMILTGEIMSSSDQALGYNFAPVHYNIVDELHIDKKVKAMKAYSQETVNKNHPRSEAAIRALATVRGASVGKQYAEAFVVMRSLSY